MIPVLEEHNLEMVRSRSLYNNHNSVAIDSEREDEPGTHWSGNNGPCQKDIWDNFKELLLATSRAIWKSKHNDNKKSESEVAQLCLTLCDPMDCSLPGFSIHGIFQARVLEWFAISFSRGSFQPRDWTRVSCVVSRRFTIWATKEVLIIRNNY